MLPSLLSIAVRVPWDVVLLVSMAVAIAAVSVLLLRSLRGHDEPD